MTSIQFIYSGDRYDSDRELVVTNIINKASLHIELPKKIEIQFTKLSDSVYAEVSLDSRFRNRIKIDENLSPKEVIVPTVHELLHLSQIHTGRLVGRRDGSFLWEGKVHLPIKGIDHRAWKNLPWEVDVAEKQQNLLDKILNSVG